MHELSLAMEICRLVEAHVGAEALPAVSAVGVVVGDEAGVELSSLTFCLDALVAQPPFAGARVDVTRVPDDSLRLDYVEIDDERPGH